MQFFTIGSGIAQLDFTSRLFFGLFVRMHMVERIGSGINRVKDLVAEVGLPPVVFTMDGMFAATVSRPDGGEKLGEKLSKNQRLIIEAMLQDHKISQQELAEAVGISTTSIENNIRQLRQLGLVSRIGPAKGGHWVVNVNPEKV